MRVSRSHELKNGLGILGTAEMRNGLDVARSTTKKACFLIKTEGKLFFSSIHATDDWVKVDFIPFCTQKPYRVWNTDISEKVLLKYQEWEYDWCRAQIGSVYTYALHGNATKWANSRVKDAFEQAIAQR
jgi:hypothetical protein